MYHQEQIFALLPEGFNVSWGLFILYSQIQLPIFCLVYEVVITK